MVFAAVGAQRIIQSIYHQVTFRWGRATGPVPVSDMNRIRRADSQRTAGYSAIPALLISFGSVFVPSDLTVHTCVQSWIWCTGGM